MNRTSRLNFVKTPSELSLMYCKFGSLLQKFVVVASKFVVVDSLNLFPESRRLSSFFARRQPGRAPTGAIEPSYAQFLRVRIRGQPLKMISNPVRSLMMFIRSSTQARMRKNAHTH